MTEDYKDYKLRGKVHAPFSPILMEFQIHNLILIY